MTPLKVDNWTKSDTPQGGYRTLALPENDSEPTPAPRHVYHAFEYVPELKAVFICNGANQTVIDKAGKRLYGANRNHDSIATMAVQADGSVKLIANTQVTQLLPKLEEQKTARLKAAKKLREGCLDRWRDL